MSSKYKIYDTSYPYFLTFSTVEWIDLFTRPIYKDIIIDCLRFHQERKGLEVYAFCLMSNHLHLIGRAPDLSGVIRDFKKFTANQLASAIAQNPQESRRSWLQWMLRSNGERNPHNVHIQVWQNDSHPIELSDGTRFLQRLHYVHENPVRAGICYAAEDYVYSSAAQ